MPAWTDNPWSTVTLNDCILLPGFGEMFERLLLDERLLLFRSMFSAQRPESLFNQPGSPKQKKNDKQRTMT